MTNELILVLLIPLIIFTLLQPNNEKSKIYSEQMIAEGWEECGWITDTWYFPGHVGDYREIIVQLSSTCGWTRKKWFDFKRKYTNEFCDGFEQHITFDYPLKLSNGQKVFSTREIPELKKRDIIPCTQ